MQGIAFINMINVTDSTDCYFNKSLGAAAAAGHNPTVLYQVFQKKSAILAGMKPALAVLDDHITEIDEKMEVWALDDGDEIKPNETVMLIRAPFQSIVAFESVYLGILAECTKIATNVRAAVKAANGKPVLFFPARFALPESQYYHGYAAAVGGVSGCATQWQADGWSEYTAKPAVPVGTMPHALIAAFRGDTAAAAIAFAEAYPKEPVWALVDFHNDCANTAVEVYKAMKAKGLKLTGVRLDTSERLVDEGIAADVKDAEKARGVNPYLVRHVRHELNQAGANEVKIGVSGGFTAEKIELFEKTSTPVDVYAVGESFLAGSNPFTSDIVSLLDNNHWIPAGKVGRVFNPNPRLKQLIGISDTTVVAGAS